VKQAAAYFAQLPYRSRIRVVEAALAPEAEVDGFTLARRPGGGTAPIGRRILELPDDHAPHVPFEAPALIKPKDSSPKRR